jgi:hypothetical protein
MADQKGKSAAALVDQVAGTTDLNPIMTINTFMMAKTLAEYEDYTRPRLKPSARRLFDEQKMCLDYAFDDLSDDLKAAKLGGRSAENLWMLAGLKWNQLKKKQMENLVSNGVDEMISRISPGSAGTATR